jgi:hypothetical protein
VALCGSNAGLAAQPILAVNNAVTVYSVKDLRQAFLTNGTNVILLGLDITMTDAAWPDLVTMSQDTTVTAAPGTSYPVWDFDGLKNKVLVPSGMTLTLDRITVKRTQPLSQPLKGENFACPSLAVQDNSTVRLTYVKTITWKCENFPDAMQALLTSVLKPKGYDPSDLTGYNPAESTNQAFLLSYNTAYEQSAHWDITLPNGVASWDILYSTLTCDPSQYPSALAKPAGNDIALISAATDLTTALQSHNVTYLELMDELPATIRVVSPLTWLAEIHRQVTIAPRRSVPTAYVTQRKPYVLTAPNITKDGTFYVSQGVR